MSYNNLKLDTVAKLLLFRRLAILQTMKFCPRAKKFTTLTKAEKPFKNYLRLILVQNTEILQNLGTLIPYNNFYSFNCLILVVLRPTILLLVRPSQHGSHR